MNIKLTDRSWTLLMLIIIMSVWTITVMSIEHKINGLRDENLNLEDRLFQWQLKASLQPTGRVEVLERAVLDIGLILIDKSEEESEYRQKSHEDHITLFNRVVELEQSVAEMKRGRGDYSWSLPSWTNPVLTNGSREATP